MTIRLRLALIITAVALVLLTVGGILFVQQLNYQLEHQLDLTLDSRADVVSSELARTGPNLTVGTGLGSSNGIYAQVLTSRGVVLESSRSVAGAPLVTPAQAGQAAQRSLAFDSKVILHIGSDTGPESMHVLAAPSGKHGTVVVVAASRDLIDQVGAHITRELLIAGVIVLLLVGPGGWWVAGAALRPVERLRARVALMDAETIAEGVPVPGSRNELARLGRTFNDLLARVHATLSREREFVADAGHELRTPLSVLKGELELAQRPGRTREDLLDTVGVAADETERLISLAENLLGLAREASLELRPFDLADMTAHAVEGVAARAAARYVSVRVDDHSAGVVYGNADRLRQALDNLLTNAVRYIREGGTVTVRLTRQGSEAVMEVADDGPGFPVEFLPIAFDRFTRAEVARGRAQGGNGLGLAVVAVIMTAHGGTATASNRPEGGAMVTLRWPQLTP